MTTYVTVDNKVLRNDDVKKYDLGLESQNQDRIYLPFASYKGDILARAYEVIYWSTYGEGLCLDIKKPKDHVARSSTR